MPPRCSFCHRPVRRLWFRCPVCGTRRWVWYLIAAALALAAALAWFFVYTEADLLFLTSG